MNEFRNIQAAKIRAMYGESDIVKSEDSTIEKVETDETVEKSENEGLEKGPTFEDLENMNNLEKTEE